MSVPLMKAVWSIQADSHTEKLVLLALADHANDSGLCWPSLACIAKKCQLTEQAVRTRLRALESKTPPWLITTLRQGHASSYVISLPPNAVDPPTPLPLRSGFPYPSCPVGGSPPHAVAPEPSVEPSLNHQGKIVGVRKAERRSTIKNSTVIPLELDDASFREMWEKWLDHLKQKRKPPSLHAQDLQLRRLAAGGLVKAIETITWSIEHNWQGLFEKTQSVAPAQKPKRYV